MMEFLVKEFKSLNDLSALVPKRTSPHPVLKARVAPMKIILFKDEKYKAETIDILSQLSEDACVTGAPQVDVSSQSCISTKCTYLCSLLYDRLLLVIN